VQVTAYGIQTAPDRGVVRSCDPLQNCGASIISLEQLNLKSSNFTDNFIDVLSCQRSRVCTLHSKDDATDIPRASL